MHGIAIPILKCGYLDDNTALSRYSASCGPDHDSRMSKKKEVVLARVRNVKNQVLKLNSFITVACYLC